MARHELKILPEYFQAHLDGTKTDELRQEADRTFAVGDVLVLEEWEQKADEEVYPLFQANRAKGMDEHAAYVEANRIGYTGRTLTREVTYVLRDPDHRWLQPGVVALSLRAVEGGRADAL